MASEHEKLHLKARQYETLHNDPQCRWCWVIEDCDGEVVGYEDDFDSEENALSAGRASALWPSHGTDGIEEKAK